MKIPKNKKNLSLIFLSILFFALVVIYLGVDKSTYAFQSDSQFGEYVLNPEWVEYSHCLLYTSPSPRDSTLSRMPSSA